MAKKIIRLTEGELKEGVAQCVNKVLLWNENNEDYIHRQMVDEALIYSYETNMVIRHLCNTFYLSKGLRGMWKSAKIRTTAPSYCCLYPPITLFY